MTSRTQERTPSAVQRAEGSKDRWDAESTDSVHDVWWCWEHNHAMDTCTPCNMRQEELTRTYFSSTPTASDKAELFEVDVAAEANRIRVREAARALIVQEHAPPPIPFDAGTLDEILDRPPEPPYRVQNLIPADAGTLLVAQRKTGKTTWALNLARSLITGERFLDQFDVLPITGRVAFLNFEVSGATFATWAQEAGIPADRLYVVNLRGRRNPFTHPDDRAALAGLLKAQDVEAVFIDPFGRAYDGTTQNDAGEVGSWLMRLDTFTRTEVGARDLILAAHAGWNGERTRGSSALEDWADVVVTLTSNLEDNDPSRYMRAIGRDVDLDEDQLHFDNVNRSLTLTGTGSRKAGRDARAQAVAEKAITEYVKTNPGCSGGDILRDVEGRNEVLLKARRQLVVAGGLFEDVRKKQGGGKTYTTTEPLPTPPNPSPEGPTTPPTPSLEGGVVKENFQDEPLPDPTDPEPDEEDPTP